VLYVDAEWVEGCLRGGGGEEGVRSLYTDFAPCMSGE